MYNFNAPSIATPIPPSTRKPPTQKDTSPSGHEIYNFGRPFLGYHYYILNLSVPCSRDEKREREEILHFHYMTKLHPLGMGVVKFTNSFFLTLQMLHTKFGKL